VTPEELIVVTLAGALGALLAVCAVVLLASAAVMWWRGR
jgi:hypothetical protein